MPVHGCGQAPSPPTKHHPGAVHSRAAERRAQLYQGNHPERSDAAGYTRKQTHPRIGRRCRGTPGTPGAPAS
jgi:hypothetical protein